MIRWVMESAWGMPVVGTLLLTPLLAVAGPLADDVDGTLHIHVPPYRVGDVMLWENDDGWLDTSIGRYAIEFGPVETARDAFGTDHVVHTMRSDSFKLDEGRFVLDESRRCWVTGSGNNIRIEHLGAAIENGTEDRRGTGSEVPGVMTRAAWWNQAHLQFAFFFSWCGPSPASTFSDVTLHEGQRIPRASVLHDLFGLDVDDPTPTSEPGEQMVFAGRPALRFTFDLSELPVGVEGPDWPRMSLDVVVAKGIPGIAAYRATLHAEHGPPSFSSGTVIGFQPAAEGAPPLPDVPAGEVPTRHPTAAFRPMERLGLDDTAYGLPFRFAAAWQAAIADAPGGMQAFLAQHPDAFLRHAEYDRHARHGGLPSAETLGAWRLAVCAASGAPCHAMQVVRLRDPLDVGLDVTAAWNWEGPTQALQRSAEPSIIGSADALKTIRRAVPAFGAVQHLQYDVEQPLLGSGGGPGAFLTLSDISRHDTTPGVQRGLDVHFNLHVGSVAAVDQRVVEVTAAGLPFDGNEPAPDLHGLNLAQALATPAGIGSTLAASFGAGMVIVWLVRLLAAPLFTRVARNKLLDHPRRQRIMVAIEAEPGIHFQALRRVVDLGRGTLDHHLRKLSSAGLIVVKISASHTCYFPRGKTSPEIMQAATHLRAPGARAVFDATVAEPGITVSKLAERTGLSVSTASHHVRRLHRAGLVEPARVGRTVTVRPTQLAGAANNIAAS